MEPDKNTPPAADGQAPKEEESKTPVDALSLTPEELDKQQAEQAAANPASTPAGQPGEKKQSAFKRIFRKVNLYFLIFILIVVVAGAIAIVNYLNSQKAPVEPTIASQELTQDALKQLANTDATVGNASQTLTIQGNAIISGQTLMRGNLNVAGNIQSGGSIQGPTLTISGTANLGQAQINSLQVATNVAVQGTTTLRDLNVAGTSSFSGPVTVSQITVTRLIMSGNAVLQIPNHISFTGASPSRTANSGVLGNGGSASVNGSDTTGTVNINTGNNPTPGCFVRINFQQTFSNSAHVIISPVGAGAGATEYYVDRNNSGFSICTNNAAPANQVFAFDYFVTN
jgi:cytoskeletal protein CcmA (bactofilin family)